MQTETERERERNYVIFVAFLLNPLLPSHARFACCTSHDLEDVWACLAVSDPSL